MAWHSTQRPLLFLHRWHPGVTASHCRRRGVQVRVECMLCYQVHRIRAMPSPPPPHTHAHHQDHNVCGPSMPEAPHLCCCGSQQSTVNPATPPTRTRWQAPREFTNAKPALVPFSRHCTSMRGG